MWLYLSKQSKWFSHIYTHTHIYNTHTYNTGTHVGTTHIYTQTCTLTKKRVWRVFINMVIVTVQEKGRFKGLIITILSDVLWLKCNFNVHVIVEHYDIIKAWTLNSILLFTDGTFMRYLKLIIDFWWSIKRGKDTRMCCVSPLQTHLTIVSWFIFCFTSWIC